jgi:hypothetical protein
MGRGALKVGLLALWVGACLDPLYEDGAPLDSGWVLCCADGQPSTCFCPEASRCAASVVIYACAAHRCSLTPSCESSTGTGGGGGSGGGSGMGGSDAGSWWGGDAGAGGGPADGGTSDGGATSDGGTPPLDAGAITSGDAGSVDAGGGGPASYGFCCVLGQVTTCACPEAGCAPFTPCAQGSCVEGGGQRFCP